MFPFFFDLRLKKSFHKNFQIILLENFFFKEKEGNETLGYLKQICVYVRFIAST